MNKRINILFFTPYFGRTGSEINLLNLVNRLIGLNVAAVVFSWKKGVLRNQLDPIIPYHYNIIRERKLLRFLEQIFWNLFRVKLFELYLLYLNKKYEPQYWYLNTILAQPYVSYLKKSGQKFIIHFHELNSIYEKIDYETMKFLVENSVMQIGCSDEVCENLRRMNASNVKRLNETIDLDKIESASKRTHEIAIDYPIKSKKYIWLISGVQSYRKGIDVIPQLALFFPDDLFIWLGKNEKTGLNYLIEKELNSRRLSNCIFTGELEESYYDYFKIADTFLLLSREDPYPLVLAEAAYFDLPIICFNSGGATSFVQLFEGKVVSLHDTEAFIKEMICIKNAKTNKPDKQIELFEPYRPINVANTLRDYLDELTFTE